MLLKISNIQAPLSRMFPPTPWLDIGRSKVLLTNLPRVDSTFNSRLAITLALKGALVPCKGNKDPPYRQILEISQGILSDSDWDRHKAAIWQTIVLIL